MDEQGGTSDDYDRMLRLQKGSPVSPPLVYTQPFRDERGRSVLLENQKNVALPGCSPAHAPFVTELQTDPRTGVCAAQYGGLKTLECAYRRMQCSPYSVVQT